VSTFDHACALVSVARYSPIKLPRKFDRVRAALARYIVALIDYFIANLTIASRGRVFEISASADEGSTKRVLRFLRVNRKVRRKQVEASLAAI